MVFRIVFEADGVALKQLARGDSAEAKHFSAKVLFIRKNGVFRLKWSVIVKSVT